MAEQDLTRTSNIWQTMVKSVRDVDVRKITDTKEDIDTLLVFAGLFSAVVTTFVVDSYSSLQPDNTDELVYLMRQSFAQNYTFTDGVLRPITPFPQNLAFEAPLWALRVNGLWFASLIVSLSTASFGMLVKQWLIEYLAMDWISPEEQLRARQYRCPGLDDWKVFEIAAMLPLLLHLSLGLFFIGLCFYTAAANEIVGHSTVPLVAGWAFFALLTVAAPLASPRCPYKVTLLKTALRVGRCYITVRLRRPLSAVRRFLLGTRSSLVGTGIRTGRTIKYILLGNSSRSGFVPTVFTDWSRKKPLHIIVLLVLLLAFPLFAFLIVFPIAIFHFIAHVELLKPDTSDEEGHMMRQPYQPHELLLSVDKIILNDGPVLETMAGVLKQTLVPPPLIVKFVLGCIQHRLGKAICEHWVSATDGRIRELPSLDMLSEGAWLTLLGLVTETLQPDLRGITEKTLIFNPESNLWMANASALILSNSYRPLPPTVRTYLTDPAVRASMLELSRNVMPAWHRHDILNIIWTAFTAHDRSTGIQSHRTWDLVPCVNGDTLTTLQKVSMSILLEHAWRGDRWAPEAILVLAFMLNTSPPTLYIDDPDMKLPVSYYRGQPIETAVAAIGALYKEFSAVSSPLSSVVRTAPHLLPNVLKFYRCLISESLTARDPLWRALQTHDSTRLQRLAAHPAVRDLWDFMLSCAQFEEHDGDDPLHRDEFVKLCLVLAVPGVPRAFGRVDPAADWLKLLPVLAEASAGRARAAATTDVATPDAESVPGLARRALWLLDPGDPDVPSELQAVLEQLAGTDTVYVVAPGGDTAAAGDVVHDTPPSALMSLAQPLRIVTGRSQDTLPTAAALEEGRAAGHSPISTFLPSACVGSEQPTLEPMLAVRPGDPPIASPETSVRVRTSSIASLHRSAHAALGRTPQAAPLSAPHAEVFIHTSSSDVIGGTAGVAREQMQASEDSEWPHNSNAPPGATAATAMRPSEIRDIRALDNGALCPSGPVNVPAEGTETFHAGSLCGPLSSRRTTSSLDATASD
ncbi:hypothetical protein PsYK624_115330 [Phanerochaete sordida]|uniref:DUF6535 domain-containing protein n=1 Tax=Phanerochaete sordida TaxID=48140 RepID=A0A9P3LI64_9APHY|nr:hypothetical protein PsYK624_115330 [Phanerochaete sordida]